MGWTLDAIQLATTKLKTRRIRLAISVVIAGVLFCILMAVSFTVHGTLQSIVKFRNNGLTNRYVAEATPHNDPFSLSTDPALIRQAKALEKQYLASKAAEAKRLNVPYDTSSEQPFVNSGQGTPDQLNLAVPQVQKLVAGASKGLHNGLADLKKIAEPYGAKAYYLQYGLGNSYSGQPPYLQVLKNNKEDYSPAGGQPAVDQGGPPSGPGQSQPFSNFGTEWTMMSPQLLEPFLLSGQNLNLGKDGSTPVIAPYSEVEKMLGLTSLPDTASTKAKLDRLKEIRSKAAGYVFSVCYRNSTSSDQLNNAYQQQQDIKANHGKAGYQLPDLVYDVPAKACGPVRIQRDARSADAKAQDANQLKFDRDFGKPAPQSYLLKFRIVGMNSDVQGTGSISVVNIFTSVLQSSLGSGWFSPVQSSGPNKAALDQIFGLNSPLGGAGYLVEFNNGQQLERIVKEQNCQIDYNAIAKQQAGYFDPSVQFKQCNAQGKYFDFNAFGSNSVAVDKIQSGFDHYFLLIGGGLSIIAALILMGTVGRIIADSRRETAVFRAIGAKRRDIIQIYVSYTLMLAGIVIIFCLVVGYLLSSYFNYRYSPGVSVNALVAFNIPDTTEKFSMTGFYLRDALYLMAMIVLAALLAASLPLLTNMRRNPIRDMRDER